MKRNFARTQFNRMLTTTAIAALVTFVSGIADTVFAGHIFGESALAGVNLVSPLNSLVMFLSTTVAFGASIYRSLAIGRCDRKAMDLCCSTGLWAALAAGILLVGVILGKDAYFNLMGVKGEARTIASAYCVGYLGVAALAPFYNLFYNLVSADGGHRHCRVALFGSIAAKLLLSYPLSRWMGIGGLPLATAVGLGGAAVVMLLYRRSRTCTLRFIGGFSLRVFVKGLRFSVLDQLFMFGEMVKMSVINMFVVSRFGEGFLPVVPAFTAVSMLFCLQSATTNATCPLMGVYFGERNYVRVRGVARYGISLTAALGFSVSMVVFAFPGLVTSFIGLTDARLLPYACQAVRIASAFLTFALACGYLESYYLYTEHFGLSLAFVTLDSCLAPVVFGVGFGSLFAISGLWTGLAISPLMVLVGVLIFVYLKFGRRSFPYLLPSDSYANIFVYDLELTEREIIAASEKVMNVLVERGLYAGKAIRAPLLVEEALMIVRERNKGRRIVGEVTLDLNGGVALILRDDGEIFNLTDSDASISSLRVYLVANLMSNQEEKINLITTGINRNSFRF